MTPADKRVADLLDRWLASVELHLKYVALDDAAYRQIQSWPDHERPNRWILELAQQKILQLKSLSQMHAEQRDGSFAEGLELMAFLANLVGVQNIKRFVPVAEPPRESRVQNSATPVSPAVIGVEAKPIPVANPPTQPIAAKGPALSIEDSATRELPTVKPNPTKPKESDQTREMPRLDLGPKKPAPSSAPVPAPSKRAHVRQTQARVAPAAVSSHDQEVVVADAVRLLKWGREWHELADLIARMAERPGAADVRRILKSQRKTIERQSSR